jgi:hypothetical protein
MSIPSPSNPIPISHPNYVRAVTEGQDESHAAGRASSSHVQGNSRVELWSESKRK